MCSSSPIEVRAGAVIDEHNGERKAKADMISEVFPAMTWWLATPDS
jgi:hypothetical protein